MMHHNLRLKTAEFAYTFQDKWVKKAGLSGTQNIPKRG